ncbi:MAG: hypothetical protein PVJ49_17695, partial [Acidobacteriota bacterium]
MSKRVSLAVLVLFVATLTLSAAPAGAQTGSGKRPLTHDDYDAWKRIQGQRISPDGAWVAYEANPEEGDGELIVHNVASGNEFRQPRGTGARFSADSAYLVFLIAPEEEEVDQAREDKTKPEDMPKNALGIMNLADGSVSEVARVKSFALPEDSGDWVAYLHEGPTSEEKEAAEDAEEPAAEEEQAEAEEGGEEKEKDFGTTMTVRSLTDAGEWDAAAVLDYQPLDDGSMVVFTVSSEDDPAGDGVYTYQPANGSRATVISGEGNYERLAFTDAQDRMAFVTDRDDYDAEAPTFNLYGWDVGSAAAELWVSHTSTAGFPAGMAVSNLSGISFDDDGGIVLFGIKEIPEPEPDDDDGDDEERAVFDLWSWDDPYPQPQQLEIRERVENETWESVYHVDSGRFVQLADEGVPDVRLSDDGSVAFAQTNVPYTKEISYYGTFNDVYVIDPMTGERTLVAEHIFRGANMSPGGRYVMWFGKDDYDWYLYDVAEHTTRNLTESLDVRFDLEDWDTPQAAGSYGIAGWLDDDEGVLVYDRFDIWMLRPDGSEARLVTDGYGRAYQISLRYLRLDPDEDTIDPDAELLLDATNEQTMATGFYRDSVNGRENP